MDFCTNGAFVLMVITERQERRSLFRVYAVVGGFGVLVLLGTVLAALGGGGSNSVGQPNPVAH